MVDVEILRDLMDAALVAEQTRNLHVCRGRRLVDHMLTCTHCGSDDPAARCNAPRSESMPRTQAEVAEAVPVFGAEFE